MKKSVARLGVGGPVGSGKTALLERLLPLLMQQGIEVAVVTNDLLTQEDADRLKRQGVLPANRIVGVETGSCPHTAIREDPTMNLLAIRNLERAFPELDLVFVESGGDNLASTFSYDLIDAYIFVLDVGAGDDIPRKNGPGFMQADLVVINKIDIAPYVGADLNIIDRDATERRKGKPIAYTNCKTGEGLDRVMQFIFDKLLFQSVR
ncbi:urease accessory protein UreG [Chamaesiphon minutus]|uniref:Urease accessory protein UreG n=2 Tax=Cyanophyceae TaxID=3028117 RepID=K9UEQ0_CHAP6|nr:urease accessory protein UreG [Chamaesiphon minutus]AFY93602.1 urease accessory protein UreG [Chamaesiphon minutus PCC 6605]